MKKLFILFVAVAMVAAFTVPAAADAEWNFYGSARMGTWYADDDPDTANVDSDKGTEWAQQGNSRIGATVKFNDEIGGAFEMSDSFGKRKLYGTYNFGGGELLLGQTYTPASGYFYSNSVYAGDGDLLGLGQFYSGRQQMIRLKFGGFKIAFIKPNVGDYTQVADILVGPPGSGIWFPGDDYDTDVTLPKIEANFGFKTDVFFVDVFGGYQTFDLESTVAGMPDADSIDSMVYGVGGGANFGPVYFKAGVHAGTNLGDYGAAGPPSYTTYTRHKATINTATGDVEDNDALGYLLVVGFNLGDAATLEAGYGYQEYDANSNAVGAQADEMVQYYVNATINITKGFFVVPEIGMIDRKEGVSSTAADPDEGDVTYFGLKWQINF